MKYQYLKELEDIAANATIERDPMIEAITELAERGARVTAEAVPFWTSASTERVIPALDAVASELEKRGWKCLVEKEKPYLGEFHAALKTTHPKSIVVQVRGHSEEKNGKVVHTFSFGAFGGYFEDYLDLPGDMEVEDIERNVLAVLGSAAKRA